MLSQRISLKSSDSSVENIAYEISFDSEMQEVTEVVTLMSCQSFWLACKIINLCLERLFLSVMKPWKN